MGAGSIIKELANKNEMSLKELARKIDISYNTLYAIVKRDSKKIDYSVAKRISEVFNISVEDIFFGTGTELNIKPKALDENSDIIAELFKQEGYILGATEEDEMMTLTKEAKTVFVERKYVDFIFETTRLYLGAQLDKLYNSHVK